MKRTGSKLTLELIQNGSSKCKNQNLIKKIYGFQGKRQRNWMILRKNLVHR
jgi:hypothetical protein